MLFKFDINGPLANISSMFFFLFRPTIKIRGSLLKKQANGLSDKHRILQIWSTVYVATLLDQHERPPRKYSYRSTDIHYLQISLKLGYRALNARMYVRCAVSFIFSNGNGVIATPCNGARQCHLYHSLVTYVPSLRADELTIPIPCLCAVIAREQSNCERTVMELGLQSRCVRNRSRGAG